jgi:hypothetical protein
MSPRNENLRMEKKIINEEGVRLFEQALKLDEQLTIGLEEDRTRIEPYL